MAGEVEVGAVGVLALQGDFTAHRAALRAAGLETASVRGPADLVGISGLVLPGGESTTMLRLLRMESLQEPLVEVLAGGMPVLATCAGLILLADEVVDPEQESLGILDVTVRRNGYGRQVHSGSHPLLGPTVPPGATGVFIRAPRVLRTGPGVQVLARRGKDPVLLRQGRVLAACFHPELDPDHFVIEEFAAIVRDPSVTVAGEGMAWRTR